MERTSLQLEHIAPILHSHAAALELAEQRLAENDASARVYCWRRSDAGGEGDDAELEASVEFGHRAQHLGRVRPPPTPRAAHAAHLGLEVGEQRRVEPFVSGGSLGALRRDGSGGGGLDGKEELRRLLELGHAPRRRSDRTRRRDENEHRHEHFGHRIYLPYFDMQPVAS